MTDNGPLFDLLKVEQAHEIDRVSSRIAGAIVDFCKAHPQFHADDLRRYVMATAGTTAPASADRILRDLRARGIIRYHVISRSKSLYAVDQVAA